MKKFDMQLIESLVNSGLLRRSHSAWYRGYVSRKIYGIVRPYDGRFGRGFTVLTPSFKSSIYCRITYYVTTDLFDCVFIS